MTGYAVRPAGAADLATIRVLREGWAQENGVDPAADPGFADRLAGWWQRQAALRHTWVAWAGRTPVGMAAVVRFERMPAPGRPDGAWGYVSQVWVDPRWRRQGVATALMGAAIESSRLEGLVRLVVNPSDLARGLYAGAGFRAAADDLLVLGL